MKKVKFKAPIAFILALVLFTSLYTPANAFVTDYEFDVAKGLVTAFTRGEQEPRYTSAIPAPTEIDADKILSLVCVVLPYKIELYQSTAQRGSSSTTTFSIKFKDEMSTAELKSFAKDEAATVVKSGMTDIEKVKEFHDYIAINTEYVLPEEIKSGKNTDFLHTAVGTLLYRKAVCDGYARAFMLMCESQNIPAIHIGSDVMNHAWNAVYLDGAWRLLDVTWDDDNKNKTVKYEYYLSLDNLREHYYDDGIKGNIDYPDHLKMANWYYFERFTPEPTDPATEVSTKMAQLSAMSQQELADRLVLLGKFKGTELGYELERVPNRVEAATMFSRMDVWASILRHEEERYKQLCPFSDVPEWAAPTLGILADSGLVNGIAPGFYGAYNPASARDYATMMLRLMRYKEGTDFTWETSLDKARELGMIKKDAYTDVNAPFTRGDMVEMTVRSLFAKMPVDDITFGTYQSIRGVVSGDYESVIGIVSK